MRTCGRGFGRALLCGAFVAASFACASGEDPMSVQGAVSYPNVVITSPVNGSLVEDDAVEVRVRVTRFSLANDYDQPNASGRGHLILYLDETIPTTPRNKAFGSRDDRYVVVTERSYTWKDLDPGTHRFGVQLVNNDHSPLEPPVTAEVSVIVVDS